MQQSVTTNPASNDKEPLGKMSSLKDVRQLLVLSHDSNVVFGQEFKGGRGGRTRVNLVKTVITFNQFLSALLGLMCDPHRIICPKFAWRTKKIKRAVVYGCGWPILPILPILPKSPLNKQMPLANGTSQQTPLTKPGVRSYTNRSGDRSSRETHV